MWNQKYPYPKIKEPNFSNPHLNQILCQDTRNHAIVNKQ